MQHKLILSFTFLLSALFIGSDSQSSELKIENEKYTLENGLQVILHEDKSDPIVAVAVLYHVGSNREVKGRTGFTHLFEHIMFQESQHIPQDQFFKKIQNAGGTLNGGTWNDGTIFFPQSPSYNIRGTTSIGQGGNALVLIDGVEGDPSLLNPKDIASVSRLKDAASAAIYGARGAFGVVLITTKNPEKGKTSVTFSSNYAIKTPMAVPDFVTDGYTYVKMFSEAFLNGDGSFPQNINKTQNFSQAYLDAFRAKVESGQPYNEVEIDPVTGEYVYFASTDYYDDLYKDHTLASENNGEGRQLADCCRFMIRNVREQSGRIGLTRHRECAAGARSVSPSALKVAWHRSASAYGCLERLPAPWPRRKIKLSLMAAPVPGAVSDRSSSVVL